MIAAETMVRMGELAVARAPGEVLASIGLGSCIGLALVSRVRPTAGLAHVMLPDSANGNGTQPGKYADQAVPTLIAELGRAGARVYELDAVLVGGAQMFALGSGGVLDIGARNEAAVRQALAKAGVTVRAAATAGDRGRTIRVRTETGQVLVKEVGGREQPLYLGRAA
jgi:chemotaxis protein CheD